MFTVPATVFFLAIAQPATQSAPSRELDVRVDPRVELLSIVFRLAGNPEYNMDNSKSPYSDAVEAHFGHLREHRAVKLARSLRRDRGISYDAVMSLAIHLDSDLSPPRPIMPLAPRPALLEGRWREADAARFIEALVDFVRDSDFHAFLAQQRERFERCATRLAAVANQRDYVAWFDGFFGTRPQARFAVVVGMLCGGGNYGVSLRHADGREEITPVLGVYRWDDAGVAVVGSEIGSTIVHELCHAYTNAHVDRHEKELERPGRSIYARVADVMRNQAYGNWKSMAYESLVRAVCVQYAYTVDGEGAGRKQALHELARGFKWTIELRGALREYADDRATYPTFDDFMPRVVEVFERIARDYDALEAKFPRLVSTRPADGANNVDPATRELVVVFDRPMIDKSWSITGGGPELPKFGPPMFDDARTTLTVPMTLEPGRRYRFGLNGGSFYGFVSAEGYPLASVEITFTTKK